MPSDHPPNEIILIDDSTDDDSPAAAPAPVASTYGPSTTPRVSAPSAKKESVDVSPGVGSSKSARPFECSICAPPSSFLSFAKLEEHRSADVHSVRSDSQRPSRRGLECPECDQQSQFSSSSALQSHWNTYHAKFAIVELPDGQTCYVPKEKGGFPCPFEHCGRHITNVLKLTAIHFKVGGCSLAERWPFPIPSNWRTDKPEGMLVLPKRPLGRPPGRPRKSLPDVVVPKRPVGRPRKSLPATLEAGQPPTTNVSSDPTTGTPVAGPSSTAGPPPKPSSSEPKRPVGRPRKSLTATVEPGLSSSANVASTFSPGSSAQPAPRPAAQTNLPVPYGSSIPSQDRAEPLAISEGLGAEWMRPANIWASVVKARSDLSQSLPTSSAVDSTNDSRRIANEIALAGGRKHRRSPLGSSEDGPASKRMKTTSSDGANQFWPPKSISESVPIPSIKRARATPFLLSKDSFSNKSDEGSSRTGKSALSGRSANDERTAAERALCKTLSLTPQRYAAIKTKLLDEYRSTEVKPRRGTSSKLCETDVNKTGKLLEFFTGIGCFGSENQDRVLSKAKKNPTPMSLLASFEGSRKSLSADERTTFRFSMIHRMQKLERMLDRKETVQTVVKQSRKGAGVVVGRGDAASGPTPDKLPKKGAGVQVDVD